MGADPTAERAARAPRVSVVIATWNRAAAVTAAIESALTQTFQDFEIVVVDDGSTDGTAAQLRERYSGEPRVSVIEQPNAGPGAARNRGIAAARGELIAFLDSDDLWMPDKLARQVALLDAAPQAGLAFCDAVYEDRGRRSPRTRFMAKKFRGDVSLRGIVEARFPLCTPATIVRRAALRDVGCFDPTVGHAEDWDLWMRLVERYAAVFVDAPLVVIRRADDNLSRTADPAKWRAWLALWLRHRERLVAAGVPRRALRRRILHARRKLAQSARAAGLSAEAQAQYHAWWCAAPWSARALMGWLTTRRR